jgi:hypothetical protein
MNRNSPSYVLPSCAVLLINEYSKPMTRSNWQESKSVISIPKLYLLVYSINSSLHDIILTNITNTEWYKKESYIRKYGKHNDHYSE